MLCCLPLLRGAEPRACGGLALCLDLDVDLRGLGLLNCVLTSSGSHPAGPQLLKGWSSSTGGLPGLRLLPPSRSLVPVCQVRWPPLTLLCLLFFWLRPPPTVLFTSGFQVPFYLRASRQLCSLPAEALRWDLDPRGQWGGFCS